VLGCCPSDFCRAIRFFPRSKRRCLPQRGRSRLRDRVADRRPLDGLRAGGRTFVVSVEIRCRNRTELCSNLVAKASFRSPITNSGLFRLFLKDKGLATDEELAPYFEQAANASNVRWRAARLRINHLLSSALKPDKKVAEKKTAKAAERSPDPVAVATTVATTETDPTKDEKSAHDAQKPTGDAKPKGDVVTAAEKSDNKQGEKNGRSAENADQDKA